MDIIKLNLALYTKMYLIRTTETLIANEYKKDNMKTPMHMSKGAEAISAGICQALKPQDKIHGTYRSHAIYLARTLELYNFFCELMGKYDGVAKGKGGSMHLVSEKHGLASTSAIVSSNIPVAVGAAFANKVNNANAISVTLFGDGAMDEGVFWESINIASSMKLPVIFVCEDNDYAVHNHKMNRQGYESINKIIENFKCNVYESRTNDVEQIYLIMDEIRNKTILEMKPAFVHFHYYRYLEHVGIGEDYHHGYRNKLNADDYINSDPLIIQREKLSKLVDYRKIVHIENEINDRVAASFADASKAVIPQKDEIHRDIFA